MIMIQLNFCSSGKIMFWQNMPERIHLVPIGVADYEISKAIPAELKSTKQTRRP
jgi:hypothetical protein